MVDPRREAGAATGRARSVRPWAPRSTRPPESRPSWSRQRPRASLRIATARSQRRLPLLVEKPMCPSLDADHRDTRPARRAEGDAPHVRLPRALQPGVHRRAQDDRRTALRPRRAALAVRPAHQDRRGVGPARARRRPHRAAVRRRGARQLAVEVGQFHPIVAGPAPRTSSRRACDSPTAASRRPRPAGIGQRKVRRCS